MNTRDFRYVRADLNQNCYDDVWYSHLPFMIFMLLLYPIGAPVFIGWKLYSSRHVLHSAETKLELGFLYEAYQPQFWSFSPPSALCHSHVLVCVFALMFLSAWHFGFVG